MKNLHRINENVLLRIYNNLETLSYYKIKDELNLDKNHYIKTTESIEEVIWDSGDYAEYINKIYSEPSYYEITGVETIEELKSIKLSILISNVDWSNLFGFHCIVKDSVTEEVLISRILYSSDFLTTENIELITGAYWLEECLLDIPESENILLVDIYKIPVSQITSEGIILNYNSDLTPLIDEKPIPDYIQTSISLNVNHFLKIEPKTEENKTLEKSILDYFEQELGNIDLTHLISYGTTELGFKELRVKNETNQFLPVIVGLDLSDFATDENDSITIFVKTEIVVDSKLMVREATLNTTLLEIINPLVEDKITHPETNYPITVTSETVINNTIIDTVVEQKIVEIFTPVFVEMIAEDILFENKYISFNNLNRHAYLTIYEGEENQQAIRTKISSDNKYYFDLNDFVPPTENVKYTILDFVGFKKIGEGLLKITE